MFIFGLKRVFLDEGVVFYCLEESFYSAATMLRLHFTETMGKQHNFTISADLLISG